MEDYSPHFTGFSGLEQQDMFSTHHYAPEEPVDLSALIEQSLTPLSVGEIINTMNQNNFMQHTAHVSPPAINTNVTTLNNLNMYQLMTGNGGSMPVIIVNIPGLVSPQTPSAEMANMNLQDSIAGQNEDIEPPCKKRRESVVDENDNDVMSLAHQMDLLRRNSLPVLHNIHVPRYSIPPSISVDDLISPSKLFRDDVDLLDEFGSEVIRAEEEEETHREQNDSPPMVSQPFNFANFYVAQPPEKEQLASAPAHPTLSSLIISPSNIPPPIQTSGPIMNTTPITPATPNADLPPKPGRQQRRRKSTPAGETPTSTPGTPVDGTDRKLVCLGKRPRKNKKTQPEDQFLMKFTMRKNK